MIVDSLAVYAPGTPLARSAYALRTRLGFPAVASFLYQSAPGQWADGLVLVVLEPQDSLLARHSPLPADSLPDRAEWHDALAPFRDATSGQLAGGLFANALQGYGAFRAGWPDSARLAVIGATSPEGAERLWRALATDTADVHRQLALWTLRHDRNANNRVAAAAVLANFPANDSTWWVLADALRDRSDVVTMAAAWTLATLAARSPRPVDWGPVTPLIRELLQGADPWTFPAVLETLAVTVSPALAAPLLKGAGFLVVGCLGTNFAGLRSPAHRLLVRLSGQDFGEEPAFWADWVLRL